MDKRTKKTLAILLAVCFVLSLTAMAASAQCPPGSHPVGPPGHMHCEPNHPPPPHCPPGSHPVGPPGHVHCEPNLPPGPGPHQP